MAYRVQFVIDIMKQSPQNATIREEYVRCSNPACQKCNLDGHGPYLYAYWKQDKKLKKRYVGKSCGGLPK